MTQSHSNNSFEWTLEIVPAHADRVDAVRGLVREIFITMIPGSDENEIIRALARVKSAGFEPVPHLAARSFSDAQQLSRFCDGLRDHAVEKVLVIAGGMSKPNGLYESSRQILESDAFDKSGVATVALAGHPEGNPVDTAAPSNLRAKLDLLKAQGRAREIVSQWSFSPDKVNSYLEQLNSEGYDIPVRIGVAGPASLRTLLKYAKICGVTAATEVLKKQGFSLGRLLVSNDPVKFVQQVTGTQKFHLYPFGGLEKTATWLRQHADAVRGAA
jgi:methylenetetrahydrofolate reductase (NADPH)